MTYHHVSKPVVHYTYSTPTYSYTPAVVSSSYVSQPVVTQPAYVQTTPATKKVAKKAEATLVLNVPEDAVVYLVGKKMKTKGTERTYRIPLANANKDYSYPIRIEVVRDGETLVSETNKTIRADQSVKLAVLETDEEGELVIAMK